MQEYLKQMVAKADGPNYYYGSGNEEKCNNLSRKRPPTNGPSYSKPEKQVRSSKAANPLEHALRLAQRFVGDKTGEIEKLKEELKNAELDLQLSNDKFAVEKNALEFDNEVLTKEIESLEAELRIERKIFVEVKKTYSDMSIALVSAKDKERKELEEQNKALMEKNATLKKELDDERKKSDKKEKLLEQAFENFKRI